VGKVLSVFDFVPMGIVGIFRSAGSGKTQAIAVTTVVLLAYPNIGEVYGSAPTYMATSSLAERLDVV